MNTLLRIWRREEKIEFSVLSWYWFLLKLSVLFSLLFLLAVFIISSGLFIFTGVEYPLGFWQSAALFTCLFLALTTLFFVDTSGEKIEVPETDFVAQLQWLGKPLELYLSTGDYTYTGKNLSISVSQKVAEPFTDEKGFIKNNDIQFPVWDSPDAKEGSESREVITALAKNESLISASIMATVRVVDRMKLLSVDDAALEFGNRMRQEFRELTDNFVDTDIAKLHSVLNKVLVGQKLITCFLGKVKEGHKVGSMIRSKSGEAMFYLVGQGGANETEADAIKKFKELLKADANTEMKKLFKKGEDDFDVNVVEVKHPLKEVLDRIGCIKVEITISDIKLSKEVQDAANQASAEQNERRSQLDSATTIRDATNIMTPTGKQALNPNRQLATVLAAAQDNKNGNVKVIMVPGNTNQLTSGLIAAANEIKEK